jgi:hypothetical protein
MKIGVSVPTPGSIQRRSNRAFVLGAILFTVAAWAGSLLAGSPQRFTHSAYVLLLCPPAALMLYAPWLVWRYWRCAECGAHLPAINPWTTRSQWHCLRCHTPFDLS